LFSKRSGVVVVIFVVEDGLGKRALKKIFSHKKKKFQNFFSMTTSVTPCFPQFVKITGLAKNYGKLINVNM
jgi:hypothetical protein